MARGRRPDPAQAKVLRGNFRADRDNPGPEVEPGAPRCPVWLPKSAKKTWRQLAPQLEKVGLITKLDGTIFAMHCDAFGRYEEVCRQLQEIDDMLAIAQSGYAQQSALFTIRNALWKQVMDSAREFGLSPAARTKLGNAQANKSPLDGWDKI